MAEMTNGTELLDEFLSMDVGNEVVIAKKLQLKFADLTSKALLSFSQHLVKSFVDCACQLGIDDNIGQFNKLCKLTSLFFDTVDFFRHTVVLKQLISTLEETLSAVLKNPIQNPLVCTAITVLTLKYCQIGEFALCYASYPNDPALLPVKRKNLKNFIKLALNHLPSTARSKNLLQFALLTLQCCKDKSKPVKCDVDFDFGHVCDRELCGDNFCVDAYFYDYFTRTAHFVLPILLQHPTGNSSESLLVKLIDFVLTPCSDDKLMTIKTYIFDLLVSVTFIESSAPDYEINLIGQCFSYCSQLVERGFSCGSDVGLWLNKLADCDLSDENTSTSTLPKVVGKFFHHFRKADVSWRGRVESLADVEKVCSLIRFVHRLPVEILNSSSIRSLLVFNITLLKIFDMSLITDDRLRTQILSDLVQSSLLLCVKPTMLDFLMDMGQPFAFLLDKTVHIASSSRSGNMTLSNRLLTILPRLPGPVYSNVIGTWISLPDSATNLDFLAKCFTCKGKQIDPESLVNLDKTIYDYLKRRKSDWPAILSHFLPIVSFLFNLDGQATSSELCTKKYVDKIRRRVRQKLASDNSTTVEFVNYFTFAVENIDLFLNDDQEFMEILLLSLIRADPTLLDDNMTTLSRCIGKILNFFNNENILHIVFREVGQKDAITRIAFARILMCALEVLDDKRVSECELVIKSVDETITTVLRRIPFWIALNCDNDKPATGSSLHESSLQFCLDVCKERKNGVRFLSLKRIQDIFSVLCAFDFNDRQISRKLNVFQYFPIVCDILSNVLKPGSSYVATLVPNYMCLFYSMQKILVSFCDDDDDCKSLAPNSTVIISQFCSVVIFAAEKFKADFSKVAPYLVGDFVFCLKQHPLPRQPRNMLLTYVYKLLDLCDEHSVALLATNLDDASKEIFRIIFDEYTKFHKFNIFA